jgi:hypothetical protein
VLDTHAGTLVIKPAPLVVTAHDQAKDVGQQDPTLTYDTRGWKFSEDEREFKLDRVHGEKPGNYSIFEKDGERLVSANYEVTFNNGVLTINGPVAQDPVDPPVPSSPPALPVPAPADGQPQPVANRADPAVAQAPSDERCTPLESPSAVIVNHTASPAIVRTYSVQLICKPRSNGTAQQQLPDQAELLDYANRLIDHGTYPFPEWNRSVMPKTIEKQAK